MNTIDYLKQIKYINIVIKQKENEKKELEDKIYSIPAVDNSKLKVKASNNRTFYTLVDRHIDEKAALEKEIMKYENDRKRIISEIRQLRKPEYIDILYKRYVEFKCFDTIACETGYSKSNVWKIHSKAIEAFEKLGVNYSKRE